MVENRTYTAQYLLRLPESLRNRIKVYAARRNTTMNFEIVRVLEREWPEQWPIEDRLKQLAQGLSALAAGRTDPRIKQFIGDFEETVEGIISGRVVDVDEDTRDAISDLWSEYEERRHEDESEYLNSEYDEEEDASISRIGRPEKYAVPRPLRKELGNLSDEEFKIYTMAYKDGLAARHETKKDDAFMRDADDSPFPDPEDAHK